MTYHDIMMVHMAFHSVTKNTLDNSIAKIHLDTTWNCNLAIRNHNIVTPFRNQFHLTFISLVPFFKTIIFMVLSSLCAITLENTNTFKMFERNFPFHSQAVTAQKRATISKIKRRSKIQNFNVNGKIARKFTSHNNFCSRSSVWAVLTWWLWGPYRVRN